MDFAVSMGIRSLCLHLVILTIQLVLRFSHLPIKMEVLMTPSRHPACTCMVQRQARSREATRWTAVHGTLLGVQSGSSWWTRS